MKRATRYAFGGGLKTTGRGPEEDIQPPATEMEIALIMGYRVTNATPGNPAWYTCLRAQRRGSGIPVGYLKFRPGAKPVLPAGVKRIEDIEGYLPDDE
jgi:hypothetical protein